MAIVPSGKVRSSLREMADATYKAACCQQAEQAAYRSGNYENKQDDYRQETPVCVYELKYISEAQWFFRGLTIEHADWLPIFSPDRLGNVYRIRQRFCIGRNSPHSLINSYRLTREHVREKSVGRIACGIRTGRDASIRRNKHNDSIGSLGRIAFAHVRNRLV